MSLQTLVYDTEGDGLLATTTKLHCAVAHEVETGRTWGFRPDQVHRLPDLLSQAKTIVCHNQIQHDLKVLYKLYKWQPRPDQKIIDTLVLVRLAFPYQKELDFELWKSGHLEGKLIGRHGLKAWGQRLGVYKGDYAEDMIAAGLDPWAEFSEPMFTYNYGDVELNTELFRRCQQTDIVPINVLDDEQEIQDIVGRMQVWGFPFRRRNAKILANKLRKKKLKLRAKAQKEIGTWWKPVKSKPCLPTKEHPFHFMPKIETPGKTLNYKDPTRAGRIKGAPFCPVKCMTFNPQSRPQIIDRLKNMYGWNPVDFTEKGNPEVSDTILRTLEDHIPICSTLADVFYINKRLSQIETGQNAWLKMIGEDGAIHGSINPLGTVSRRASHASPNVAQVPKVSTKAREFLLGGVAGLPDLNKIRSKLENAQKLLERPGTPGEEQAAEAAVERLKMSLIEGEEQWDKRETKKIELIQRGELGGHGFECRSLFYVPPPWRLMGSDLAGIEFRCLAELCAKYDNGALINVLLNEDIHTANQMAAGLETRNQAKTFIYAFMYGGGDAKLGSIVAPLASENEQRAIGKNLRDTFLRRMPALKKVIDDVKGQANSGYVRALDGGSLFVRSRHSALNLKLQSDAALIAKRWLRNFYRAMLKEGLKASWDGDFVISAWVHDEIQVPCMSQDVAELAGKLSLGAAAQAGEEFRYTCPVAADFKIGQTWAETH